MTSARCVYTRVLCTKCVRHLDTANIDSSSALALCWGDGRSLYKYPVTTQPVEAPQGQRDSLHKPSLTANKPVARYLLYLHKLGNTISTSTYTIWRKMSNACPSNPHRKTIIPTKQRATHTITFIQPQCLYTCGGASTNGLQ
jgi:hypothetical protein